MKHRVLVLALLVGIAAPLQSQGSAVADALRAYENLDFDRAVTLLRRALAGALDDSTRAQALTYLGAAEHYRGQSDSAVAAFRQLVMLAPTQVPDTLLFPPEITQLYRDVRSHTDVAIAPPPKATPPPAPPRPVTVPHPPPPPPPPPPRRTEAASTPLPALHGVTASAGATIANVRARSPGGLPPANGTVLGMTASLRFRRLELGVRYLDGSLQSRDLVEGAAALRFLATPWLTLHAGPQIRRYETPSGAERWMTWQIGARTETTITGSVRGHAMLWRGLGLSVNLSPGSGSSQGGELGATVDLSQSFWFDLSYGVDRATVRGSSRRETVNALTVTAGLRRP